jgi:hypothetical protein
MDEAQNIYLPRTNLSGVQSKIIEQYLVFYRIYNCFIILCPVALPQVEVNATNIVFFSTKHD